MAAKKEMTVDSIDLSNFSKDDLVALQNRTIKAIAEYDEKKRKEALEALKAVAGTHGYSLQDLMDNMSKKDAKKKSPPKYRHPENPELTWTGRGRRPQWLQDQMDQGRSKEDFEIN